MNETVKLQELFKCSDNIVFFCGAEVSTESGILDFRITVGPCNTAHIALAKLEQVGMFNAIITQKLWAYIQ